MGTIGIYIGLGVMVVGALLFAVGRRKQNSVVSANGSVAVGGNNSGPIVNVNQPSTPPSHSNGHGLTILSMIIELVGIGVTLWHAYHLTAK